MSKADVKFISQGDNTSPKYKYCPDKALCDLYGCEGIFNEVNPDGFMKYPIDMK